MTTAVRSAHCRKYTPTCRRCRSVRLVDWHADLKAGGSSITEGGEADSYLAERLNADYGTCFRVEKWPPADGDVADRPRPYCVCLHGDESSCDACRSPPGPVPPRIRPDRPRRRPQAVVTRPRNRDSRCPGFLPDPA